jgi:antagonist of KipI
LIASLKGCTEMARVRVVHPGMLTTVQDLGRWGFQSHGVAVAGPMDPYAHRCANALAGNGPGAATLEVTLVGPELEFEDRRLVAIAGARFAVTVDGRDAPSGPFEVAAGGRLRFGHRIVGARAYVAIGGGVTTAPVLGSRATHVSSRMGGVGRAIEGGDELPLGDAPSHRAIPRALPALPTVTGAPPTIRVIAGPQHDWFASTALGALQSSPYRLSPQSDRMGFRLEGPPLPHARRGGMISEATAIGSLQVPPDGVPILLMADRQTTGGYPKIATAITADIGLAGQLAPGDPLSFAICSLPEALAALIARERVIMAIEEAASC